jgi:hypothetical protein
MPMISCPLVQIALTLMDNVAGLIRRN